MKRLPLKFNADSFNLSVRRMPPFSAIYEAEVSVYVTAENVEFFEEFIEETAAQNWLVKLNVFSQSMSWHEVVNKTDWRKSTQNGNDWYYTTSIRIVGLAQIPALVSYLYPLQSTEIQSLNTTASVLAAKYPPSGFVTEVQPMRTSATVIGAMVRELTIAKSVSELQPFNTAASVLAAIVRETLLNESASDLESFRTTASVIAARVDEILITNSASDTESFRTTATVLGATINAA